MAADKALAWMWIEEKTEEDPVIVRARHEAMELGAEPVSAAAGATLRMLTTLMGAKAVAEVGTGAGVSGLWLLSGMSAEGTLTTIDCEDEYQRAAKKAFREAGIDDARVRVINAHALDLLPRMTKNGYDIVVLDADVLELSTYIKLAGEMLRRGGALVVLHALLRDQVCDPAQRNDYAVAMRTAIQDLLESEDYVTNLMGVGDGIAIAIKR